MSWTNEFLDDMRFEADAAADDLIADIIGKGRQHDLFASLNLPLHDLQSRGRNEIESFLNSKKVKPGWFDKNRLEQGQKVFAQYAAEIMALLGLMALPYCYAASPGNKALYLSDKMRKSPGKRLLDTASFVIDVMTPRALDDNAFGHLAINKVRVFHALSRYYIKKQSVWNNGWGEPINQEDMAGTNLAFSYITLLGLHQSGFTLSQNEKENFFYAWRYVGYLLNIKEELLPLSIAEASHLTATIKGRHFRKTEESVRLTAELLHFYSANLPAAQAKLLSSQIRFYLGCEVAGYVGLADHAVNNGITSVVHAIRSLGNMLTIKGASYQQMLRQHDILREKI